MKRLITAAIAIPIVLLLTQYSPDWLFAVLVAVMAGLMLDEFLNLSGSLGKGRPGRWFLLPGSIVAASFYYYPVGVVAAVAGTALLLAASCVFAGDLENAF